MIYLSPRRRPPYDDLVRRRNLVLLAAAALADEDPAFIVNTGDLVGRGSRVEDWRAFHEENRPIFSKGIPYFPCLGNHEFYGDDRLALQHYFSFFPGLGGRRWYEIRFRSVLLALLRFEKDGRLRAEVPMLQDDGTWIVSDTFECP